MGGLGSELHLIERTGLKETIVPYTEWSPHSNASSSVAVRLAYLAIAA
jgi:hypothetical protein